MNRPTERGPDGLGLNDVLDAAVRRAVIDARQRERLLALAAELAGEPGTASVTPMTPAREARRGFNAVSVAYSLGALLVLFALGWFLLDRWDRLGPSGVLAVSIGYAVAFAGAGIALRARGFDVAGGLAIMLAVSMTPVWTWAILRLTGELPAPGAWDDALSHYEPYIATRQMVIELATIGVALVAARRVRFFALGAPITAAFIALLLSLGSALGDPRLMWYVGGYYQCVIACAALAVAYAVERRQPAGEDYAFWFYLGGVIVLGIGYVQVWSHIGAWRHALPLVAFALVAASLYLRRRTLLVAGGVAAFSYLAYLAFDVFRRVVALPLALAALGLAVIAATVWMQRRFPALVARVSRADAAGTRTLPAWPATVLGPLAIAIVAMVFAVEEARVRTVDRDAQAAIELQRMRSRQRAGGTGNSAPVAPSIPRRDSVRPRP